MLTLTVLVAFPAGGLLLDDGRFAANGEGGREPDETVVPPESESSYYGPGGHFRAFSPGSYWNTPLPEDAPQHTRSKGILSFLEKDSAFEGCVRLVGGGSDWGMPIYWSAPSDEPYDVSSRGNEIPPEFSDLRIPRRAAPMDTRDGAMVVYDLDKGYVALLHQAEYDEESDEWSVKGGTVTYLESNGLSSELPQSDDARNFPTYRGLNGAIQAVRYDEVRYGVIEHVLKVSVNSAKEDDGVWPMTGSDGKSSAWNAPSQGLRLRIKPDIDLSRFDLPPPVSIIARALQEYGVIIGDSSGGPVGLKLENTVAEGRGDLWKLPPDALCDIPIEDFEVIAPGYRP